MVNLKICNLVAVHDSPPLFAMVIVFWSSLQKYPDAGPSTTLKECKYSLSLLHFTQHKFNSSHDNNTVEKRWKEKSTNLAEASSMTKAMQEATKRDQERERPYSAPALFSTE